MSSKSTSRSDSKSRSRQRSSSDKAGSVRLQCSNCSEIREFELTTGSSLPERCPNCKMFVGWLPPINHKNGNGNGNQTGIIKDADGRKHYIGPTCYKPVEEDVKLSKKTEGFINSVFGKNGRVPVSRDPDRRPRNSKKSANKRSSDQAEKSKSTKPKSGD